MSAPQVGKTECLLNTIGRNIDRDPTPILFIMPTAEMAQAMSKGRITQQLSEGSWGIKIIVGTDMFYLKMKIGHQFLSETLKYLTSKDWIMKMK